MARGPRRNPSFFKRIPPAFMKQFREDDVQQCRPENCYWGVLDGERETGRFVLLFQERLEEIRERSAPGGRDFWFSGSLAIQHSKLWYMIKVDVKRTRIWVPRGRELGYMGKRTTHAWVGTQPV
ncbi:hypothetical protein CK203_095986 [Vitis vinifera]|uniref:Uncharacterized protein n=1 Tax=Vitis vinifera TaxID=29760 RepID=A0A438FCA7_VITVI|nr:hypothetical protein CK203_095986 [Vitis vinifera]